MEGPPRAADGVPHDLRHPVGVEDEDRYGRPSIGYALDMRRERERERNRKRKRKKGEEEDVRHSIGDIA
jgi:hypothetical protein